MTSKKIKVFIIDDSAVARKSLSELLSNEKGIEVVGTAFDPIIAGKKMVQQEVDVLILDIEMPRMDGITFLETLNKEDRLSVIILSSMTKKGSSKALEALNLGVFDVLAKPGDSRSMAEIKNELVAHIRACASLNHHPIPSLSSKIPSKKLQKKKELPLVVIGASTGGIEILHRLVSAFPKNMPPICIVQHIPPIFSKAFAERLNNKSPLKIKEAEDGDELLSGHVYVAPGDWHMILTGRQNERCRIRLKQGEKIWHQRPSVDVLFSSIPKFKRPMTIALLLSGMGSDGVAGMEILKKEGAITIAQSAGTCAVFGMPRGAIEKGCVDYVLDPEHMPELFLRLLKLNNPPQANK